MHSATSLPLASSSTSNPAPVINSNNIYIGTSGWVSTVVTKRTLAATSRPARLKVGEVFAVPEPSIRDTVAVVPGLDGQKMSKSYGNTVEIFGAAKEVKAKIMRIVTDSKGNIFTTETYRGQRVQKFIYKGLVPLSTLTKAKVSGGSLINP